MKYLLGKHLNLSQGKSIMQKKGTFTNLLPTHKLKFKIKLLMYVKTNVSYIYIYVLLTNFL